MANARIDSVEKEGVRGSKLMLWGSNKVLRASLDSRPMEAGTILYIGPRVQSW
jgi:hypothetical protein